MGFKLFETNGKITYGIKQYIADSYKDLNNIPKESGDIVYVIDESKYYTMNTKLKWVEQKDENENISAGIISESTKVITENGIGIDVTSYAAVDVTVSQPEGKINIIENGTDIDISQYALADVAVPGIIPTGTKQISITQNGTTTHDVTDYASAEITVNTNPAKGFVFGDYDADGYPHSSEFVGSWINIPDNYPRPTCAISTWNKNMTGFLSKLEELVIPDGVKSIGENAFAMSAYKEVFFPSSLESIGTTAFSEACYLEEITLPNNIVLSGSSFKTCRSLKRIYFAGNVSVIPSQCFRIRDLNPWVDRTLVDFSHCTEILVLASSDAMEGSNGCVFRIPYALSDEALGEGNGWQSETNWVTKTYVVWEVV